MADIFRTMVIDIAHRIHALPRDTTVRPWKPGRRDLSGACPDSVRGIVASLYFMTKLVADDIGVRPPPLEVFVSMMHEPAHAYLLRVLDRIEAWRREAQRAAECRARVRVERASRSRRA